MIPLYRSFRSAIVRIATDADAAPMASAANAGKLFLRSSSRPRRPPRTSLQLFATILAVVAGLTLAAASAVSQDLYASVIARGRTTEGREVMVSRVAAVVVGLVAIWLGYVSENQNVAFMVGPAFAAAASCNFPVLAMSMLWRGTTMLGAFVAASSARSAPW